MAEPRKAFAILENGEIDIKQLTDIDDQPPGIQKRMIPVIIVPMELYKSARDALWDVFHEYMLWKYDGAMTQKQILASFNEIMPKPEE